MDPPATDGGIEREKLEELKEGGPMHHCNLIDTEITHKIAQDLLPGLASACVDNTTGGLFRSPGSVAVEIRKEMVDSLIQRSETFVAEAVVLEGGAESEVPEHSYDIISDFIDDFASSKRNFFSRVSGWLLSDRREDKIDDFVQEMEINGFWLIGRREGVAQTLLKNVDFKDAFHCNKKFNSAEELAVHLPQCSFRTMDCSNEGCDAQFTAGNMENHDAVCPFKMLPCDQKCSEILMRREMDRHCITVCPMKRVNCPFSSVGCESTFPRSTLEEHKVENMHAHVLYILQSIHKEAATEDLKRRLEQLKELSSAEQLAGPQNVRALTNVIKKLEAKLGPLELGTITETTKSEETPSQKEEFTDLPVKTEENMESANRKEGHVEQPSENKSTESPTKNEDSTELSVIKKELSGSPRKSESIAESPTKKEEHKESPAKNMAVESPAKDHHLVESYVKNQPADPPAKREEELLGSPTKDKTMGSPAKEYHSPSVGKDLSDPPAKKEDLMDSPTKNKTMESTTKKEPSVESPAGKKELSDPPSKMEEHIEEHRELPLEKNDSTNSSTQKDEHNESFKQDKSTDSPTKKEDHMSLSTEREEHGESVGNGEKSNDSPKESEKSAKKSKEHGESSSSSSSDEAES